jgi:DNA replication protein DnaC
MKTIYETLNELKEIGYYKDNRMSFCCPDAESFFIEAMALFQMEMLPEYKHVIKWMEDNEGLGLILYGANGRGKTLIAQKILPLYFFHFFKKILPLYDGISMNENVEEILKKKMVCIDDIGQEDVKNNFGEKSIPFMEIMDMAEKKGNLVILTTNLTPQWIEKKYGIRARERIRACCFPVSFVGESLRK